MPDSGKVGVAVAVAVVVVVVGVAVVVVVTVGVGVGVAVVVGVDVGVGVGVSSTVKVKLKAVQELMPQALMSVVQVPPACGQQNCWPPHDSILPAWLQMLSCEVPSESGGVQFFKTPSEPGHCSLQAAAPLSAGAVGATASCLS